MKSVDLDLINRKIKDDPSGLIGDCDEAFRRRLREIAEDIADHRHERPIILLSGPSGSGKTTTARMIEKILDNKGIETHTLSMDDYFTPLTPEEKEVLALGKLDLETPARMDKVFLSSQLSAIERCEEVELPLYDFKQSVRRKSGVTLKRKPGELVILEGIHSLNPDIISLPDEKSARIYISVRTRISSGDRLLHPSKIRLMRRMIRDSIFRKRTFEETLNMFVSVETGENKYIMPYKHRSQYDIDTFMPYEICAYRKFLLDGLNSVDDRTDINDAVSFLSLAYDLDTDLIPPDSLIREFIG